MTKLPLLHNPSGVNSLLGSIGSTGSYPPPAQVVTHQSGDAPAPHIRRLGRLQDSRVLGTAGRQ